MTVEANLLMYRQSSANDKYVKTAGGILIDTDAPTGGSGGSSSSGGMIGQASFDSGAGAISNLVVAGIVSTVTRLAVGKYAVVFAAPQPDVNYAAHMTASDDNSDPVWTYYSGLAAEHDFEQLHLCQRGWTRPGVARHRSESRWCDPK